MLAVIRNRAQFWVEICSILYNEKVTLPSWLVPSPRREVLLVSARSYDGRHRGASHAPPKHATSSRGAAPPRRRRLRAGLVLPTAAAALLTFTATGAAVVTSGKPLTSAIASSSLQSSMASTVGPDQIRATQAAAAQAATAKALVISRATYARSVARTAERKRVAARELAIKQAEQARSWQMPIPSPVRSSKFGWRWGRLHAGEDFAVAQGTKLASMSTGTVIFAGVQGGYGNLVKIRYWDGTVSYFAHMSSISATTGEDVDPGEVVGLSGNTGHSTGPHLHLEIRPNGGAPVDPQPWLAAHNIAS